MTNQLDDTRGSAHLHHTTLQSAVSLLASSRCVYASELD